MVNSLKAVGKTKQQMQQKRKIMARKHLKGQLAPVQSFAPDEQTSSFVYINTVQCLLVIFS